MGEVTKNINNIFKTLVNSRENYQGLSTTVFARNKFYRALLQQYNSEPESVLSRLEETRAAAMRPERARVTLVGDVAALTDEFGGEAATDVSTFEK